MKGVAEERPPVGPDMEGVNRPRSRAYCMNSADGATWVLCRRLCQYSQQPMTRAMKLRPPMTPPAMAPAWLLRWDVTAALLPISGLDEAATICAFGGDGVLRGSELIGDEIDGVFDGKSREAGIVSTVELSTAEDIDGLDVESVSVLGGSSVLGEGKNGEGILEEITLEGGESD